MSASWKQLLLVCATTLALVAVSEATAVAGESGVRAPSVVEVMDRHIFQTDYPDKEKVLEAMANTAYVEILCQGCVFGDDSCGPQSRSSPFL